MPPPSLLYETLLNLLQHAPWRDRRHLLTLAWMVMGLLSSGWIALDEWPPFVVSRALLAQSTERWFSRWPVVHHQPEASQNVQPHRPGPAFRYRGGRVGQQPASVDHYLDIIDLDIVEQQGIE